jgi:polyphosphate kinase
VPGLSETVQVVSTVGRFLEHSRIYYFRNGGAEQYFIASADCMKRNLESRVENLVPVEDSIARQKLRAILDAQLAPNRNGWIMQSDGSYVRSVPLDSKDRGAQQALMEWLTTHQVEVPPRTRKRGRYALTSPLVRNAAAPTLQARPR